MIRFDKQYLDSFSEERMPLSQPLILSLTNGEESIFASWSAVPAATEYEIEIRTNNTGGKRAYSTARRSILIKNLENGQPYEVQVTALNASGRSEPSICYRVRPKSRPSLSTVRVRSGEIAGTIHLRWTATPTDSGFNIERCDIRRPTGCKCIAWLPYNDVITYEDQTNCPSLEHGCSGHYYTVRYRDSAWWHGGGVLSQKVFCMASDDSYYDEKIDTDGLLNDNMDQISVDEPIVASGNITIKHMWQIFEFS